MAAAAVQLAMRGRCTAQEQLQAFDLFSSTFDEVIAAMRQARLTYSILTTV